MWEFLRNLQTRLQFLAFCAVEFGVQLLSLWQLSVPMNPWEFALGFVLNVDRKRLLHSVLLDEVVEHCVFEVVLLRLRRLHHRRNHRQS